MEEVNSHLDRLGDYTVTDLVSFSMVEPSSGKDPLKIRGKIIVRDSGCSHRKVGQIGIKITLGKFSIDGWFAR